MSDVVLRVGGREHRGWSSVRVTQGIDAVSGAFSLEVADRWADQDQPWPIAPDEPCSIDVAGTRIITGFVGPVEIELEWGRHAVAVSGRDATADLVDCSADPREYTDTPPLEVLRKLCAEYSIPVNLGPGATIPGRLSQKLTVDPGDSVFEAIDKICRGAELLPMADAYGGLVLVQGARGRCPVAVVEGRNMLGGRASFDPSDRYRTVKVLGAAPGTDTWFGEGPARVHGEATDPGARAGRKLIVRAETAADNARARARAQWETVVRAARGDRVRLRVQGWTYAPGQVWGVNTLLTVRAPSLRVSGELLIVRATYSLDSRSGETTELECAGPEAYAPKPLKAPKAGANYWKELINGVPR